jgi:hypothetical protein
LPYTLVTCTKHGINGVAKCLRNEHQTSVSVTGIEDVKSFCHFTLFLVAVQKVMISANVLLLGLWIFVIPKCMLKSIESDKFESIWGMYIRR